MKSLILTGALAFLLLLVTTRVKGQPEINDESDEFGEDEVEVHGLKNVPSDQDKSDLTLTRETRRVKRSDKHETDTTASCLIPCHNATDCYCPLLAISKNPSSPKSRQVYEYVKRFCTDGECSYCVKADKVCSFGSKGRKPKGGFLYCCDEERVDKGDAEQKGKGVDCFYMPLVQPLYRCIRACDRRRTTKCKDKHGFYFNDLVACQGKRKNTFMECPDWKDVKAQPRECGAPGATCGQVDQPCCRGCNCKNGMCIRNCAEKDVKCKVGDRESCCNGVCLNGKCP